MFATIIAYTLTVVVVICSIALLVLHAGKMGTRRLTGLNDPDITKRYFLLLLDRAQKNMVVYDDGNDVEDSVYSDDDVLSAIDTKFEQQPEFRMRCLFNCPVPEPLRLKFAQGSRLDARSTGLGDRAPRDTHLKVIDNGRMAYLTRQDYNSMTRNYELVDCLTVAPWVLKRVARSELGACVTLFEDRFQQALPT